MQHSSKRSLARFIIRLSIGATALSVAVMICASAFVNGFQHSIEKKVFSFWGHLRVLRNIDKDAGLMEEIPMERDETVEKYLQSVPGINKVSQYATKSALLRGHGTLESILLKGITSEKSTDAFDVFLQTGKNITFKDSSYSKDILLSKQVANQLQVKVNDSIIVYFFRSDGSKTARKLRISGLYKTGIEEYDKNFGICDIRLIRRLNQWPENQIGGYEIHISDYRNANQINKKIYEELPQGWYSKTIQEVYPNIFDWLQLQDQIKRILFWIMLVIAVMNLVTSLIILLLDRTPMIALLSTLGANSFVIQRIFLINSAYIAGMGVLLGTISGIGICLLQNYTHWIKLNEEAYYISVARADINIYQVLAIDLTTIIICTLCLWFPTFIIRRLNIIQAIRI